MSTVLKKNFFADGEWAVKGFFEKKIFIAYCQLIAKKWGVCKILQPPQNCINSNRIFHVKITQIEI